MALVLNALGSDLSFSIGASIGTELRTAAAEAQLSDDELIAAVLICSIVLAALPATLTAAKDVIVQSCTKGGLLTKVQAVAGTKESRSIMGFLQLLLEISRRILMSLVIQLVAASVNARQPLRFVRIMSLLSVAIFFLFLQSGASIVLVTARAAATESKET
jgi:hypothetical protein